MVCGVIIKKENTLDRYFHLFAPARAYKKILQNTHTPLQFRKYTYAANEIVASLNNIIRRSTNGFSREGCDEKSCEQHTYFVREKT